MTSQRNSRQELVLQRNFGDTLNLRNKKVVHGVATLEVDGCYMEDNKSKAEALNKQFQSVFTDEDM